MSGGRVLVVEPSDEHRQETVAALEAAGFDVEQAERIESGLAALDTVDCLVSAYDLPDGTGFDLMREARESDPDIACILFAAATLEEMETERAEGEVVEFLPKDAPNARETLTELVAHSVEMRTQTAYPLPPDESGRLEALDRYVPEPGEAEEAFDRLTRLGAALLGVSMASIGLIDEHEQQFLACHGVSLDTIPREDSICTYAILEEEVTVVEDTREDPRFEDNELLAEADIRFYASANLTTPTGAVIGTFCLYDREPRTFSETDREHLELLAAEAMDQLELRRRLRVREEGTDDV